MAVQLEDIQAAAERIKGKATFTPVLTSSTLNTKSGLDLHFKCEAFQKGGSFKIRGALNAISKLTNEQQDVVTHSSGNHAQAVALACRLTGKNAHIVMPDNAPAVKRAAVVDYGARVITCQSTQPAREAAAQAELEIVHAHARKILGELAQVLLNSQAIPNSVLIPPYDHLDVIAGQGTMGLELLQQVPDLDLLVVPVGGGGMLAGICVAAKALKPDILIVAAEPKRADDCFRSMQAQEHILLDKYPDTVADGLRTSMGKNNWPIISKHLDRVFVVDEPAIISAQRLVIERMKVLIEPSAGVPVAVTLDADFQSYANENKCRKVGAILCGGNQDIDKLPWVVNPTWNSPSD
eukprot:TRINITY_DN11206_c0_g1_i1.p1 TRINITY_DN11206_c0_g1~~TRINITY_DN11206_c0_g1_i1.p1  ORF type:complete len:351 (+),score=78.44 TRINITY_DN11206_c0_g1_i1:122-1174(+)